MSGLKAAIKAMFAITTLERHGVDTSRLQDASRDVTDVGLPTSFVLLSEDTGARTIVSSRCGLKESLLQHCTWWLIPLSKWVKTPVINGISRVNPLITGVITHLLSGMSHQVAMLVAVVSLGWMGGQEY